MMLPSKRILSLDILQVGAEDDNFFVMFALAEHINSTFAKNRVRQAGHRNAQCKGASPVYFK